MKVRFAGVYEPSVHNIIGGEDEIRRGSKHFFSDKENNILFAMVSSVSNKNGEPILNCILLWTTYTATNSLEVLQMIQELLKEPDEAHLYPRFFMYAPQFFIDVNGQIKEKKIELDFEPEYPRLLDILSKWLIEEPLPPKELPEFEVRLHKETELPGNDLENVRIEIDWDSPGADQALMDNPYAVDEQPLQAGGTFQTTFTANTITNATTNLDNYLPGGWAVPTNNCTTGFYDNIIWRDCQNNWTITAPAGVAVPIPEFIPTNELVNVVWMPPNSPTTMIQVPMISGIYNLIFILSIWKRNLLDEKWNVHFERLIEDCAIIIDICRMRVVNHYNKLYKEVNREIIRYVEEAQDTNFNDVRGFCEVLARILIANNLNRRDLNVMARVLGAVGTMFGGETEGNNEEPMTEEEYNARYSR